MSIYTFFTLIVICFLGTYLLTIQYIRYLRKERERKIRDIDCILVSILFGAPVLLVMELAFPEIRFEDGVHKYRMLISSIILTIIQITGIVLMFYFGVIKLDNSNNEGGEEVVNLINYLTCLSHLK